MRDVVFKINGRMDICFEDNEYKSNIQDVGENYIVISVPIKDGSYITPKNGDVIEVMYYEDLNAYKFIGFVIGRRTENNIPQIIIDRPHTVKKVQRREFVRVSVISYIQYVKLESDLRPINIEEKFDMKTAYKGLLMDLSGGGARLKVYNPIRIGDKIIIDIPAENDRIRVSGKIVRSVKGEDGRNVCGICFTDLDNKKRERLIQLVFTILRKQRKTF